MKPSYLIRHSLVVIAILALALPAASSAAPPNGGGGNNKVTVTAADPSDAFQGEELSVIVTGTGFDAGSTARYLVTGTADASQVDVLSVQYLSSTQLRTFIRPKANALPTDYDIEVQTSSGRKGKGTTLFRVKQGGGPPQPPPPPTEPDARFWPAFTDNGGTTAQTSRLYLFGGDGQDYLPRSDLWYFSMVDTDWVLAQPSGAGPSARKHVGLSCGGGLCVLANGHTGNSAQNDSWVYSEAGGAWSQMSCGKRNVCPTARWAPTMAYDTARSQHVLFGGEVSGSNLDDTYTFAVSNQRWTRQNPSVSPSPRRSAAAAFAGGPVNRVVLFGGQFGFGGMLCDMWSWTGSTWVEIQQTNAGQGPCLDSHSMAWDGARLVITGGYVNHFYGDVPNEGVWTFTFAADGKSGTWTNYPHWLDYFSECAGSATIRPGARMAYDRPSGMSVFFGGMENIGGSAVAYDDLTACH